MHIAAVRQRIATDLENALGIQALGALPERLVPPLAYLREADPFVTAPDDEPYGTLALSFAADLIVKPAASNAAMVRAADDLATAVLALSDRYAVTVAAYASATVAGQAYLIVPTTITLTI